MLAPHLAALLLLAGLGTSPPSAQPADPDAGGEGVAGTTSDSPPPAEAPPPPWHLDLAIHDVGIGLGGSPHIDGLRLAFRDGAPAVVHGASLTVWSPTPAGKLDVTGLAVGLPLHVSRTLRGVGVGVGVGVNERLEGIAVGLLGAGAGEGGIGLLVGGLGAGAGGGFRGIALGGLGAGAGGDFGGLALALGGAGVGGRARGLVVGGLGAGVGGDLDGLVFGLLGAGAGGDVGGFVVGGLGAGAGGDADGLVFGGLGAGVGGSARGLVLGGLGAGAGHDLTGLVVGGLGAGAGGTLRGGAVAILGTGAPTVRGGLLSLVAGGKDVEGIVVAPAHFRIAPGGRFAGVALSAVNVISGEQRGLTLGIFNWADSLEGVQIGLLNYAGNNRAGLRWLPLANAHL